jgi:phosphotransferase system  glucose/maltose/N-acetylglucosamine-specific IIC component
MAVAPTWDLFLGLFFAIGIAYSLMLREKAVTTLAAIYVGLVVSSVLSGNLQAFFAGDKPLFNQLFIRGDASPFAVQTAVLIGTVVFLTMKSSLSSVAGKGSYSPIELGIYGFFNAALLASTILSYASEATRATILESSRLAELLMNYQIWWLVLPVLFMIAIGFLKRD